MPISSQTPPIAALVAALFFLSGCSALEAKWDAAVTPEIRARAEAKGLELREELDALLDTAEAGLRDEARRLVIQGLIAP